MAINPPSDIILDVARAADPVAYQASLEKLRALAGARIEGTDQTQFTVASAAVEAPRSAVNPAFRKFEAFMLQTFVQSMFTSEGESVFGKGIAGEYWKSMMSEVIAKEMAEGGGVGIATMLQARSDQMASLDMMGGAAGTAAFSGPGSTLTDDETPAG